MTSHLFKLIYNQRRSNGWIVLELFLIFILIWVLVDFFSVLYLTARTPVGADITDTYLVKLSMTPQSSPSFIAYEEGSEERATSSVSSTVSVTIRISNVSALGSFIIRITVGVPLRPCGTIP